MQPGQEGNNWQPRSDDSLPPMPAAQPSNYQSAAPQAVSWQASEYVHHEKERLWFILLFIGALALLAVAIFLVQSPTFSILIVVMTIALAVFAVRQPKIVSYQLTAGSIQINDKQFYFKDFRYFGVMQDGPLNYVVLVPNKRFMPAVNLFFPAENGEAIVDVIGARLPMEHIQLDTFDKMMRQLRF